MSAAPRSTNARSNALTAPASSRAMSIVVKNSFAVSPDRAERQASRDQRIVLVANLDRQRARLVPQVRVRDRQPGDDERGDPKDSDESDESEASDESNDSPRTIMRGLQGDFERRSRLRHYSPAVNARGPLPRGGELPRRNGRN
jgi:hypothetical protein